MPSSSSASPSSSFPNVWHTPVPYLFGGFGAVMILIAAALVVLACSHWRSAARPSRDPESGEFMEKPMAAVVQLDMEPRLVVIMAGDDKPSFIAEPFSLVREAERKTTSQKEEEESAATLDREPPNSCT